MRPSSKCLHAAEATQLGWMSASCVLSGGRLPKCVPAAGSGGGGGGQGRTPAARRAASHALWCHTGSLACGPEGQQRPPVKLGLLVLSGRDAQLLLLWHALVLEAVDAAACEPGPPPGLPLCAGLLQVGHALPAGGTTATRCQLGPCGRACVRQADRGGAPSTLSCRSAEDQLT